jgi:hypothetical protein
MLLQLFPLQLSQQQLFPAQQLSLLQLRPLSVQLLFLPVSAHSRPA